MTIPLRQRARTTLDKLRRELLDHRTPEGHWVGQLSPSALSTATAISAMSSVLLRAADHDEDRTKQSDLDLDVLHDHIARGIDSLANQQNRDGGFGDTDRSHSNIATSYLVLAASTLADQAIGKQLASNQANSLRQYIHDAGEFEALRIRYGTDKTFVVPILTNLAIAGLADWDQIPALPFEAAVFPQSMYRLLRMPVVSYAIPALVAIGQARHFHGRRALPPIRWIRQASIRRTMHVLERMQPDSGGYLEATPLTSFVVMSLASTGRGDHQVSRRGLRFLIDSMNQDGSWPIDTNLATWVTSLSIHALASDPDDDGQWCTPELVRWHLQCQHRQRHPFTGAEPGGWGWSDLSGAVPDSDDTPAAILALTQMLRWKKTDPETSHQAICRGTEWLFRLQNRDGGWPTFCKGWGKLPFDRSSNDLTAHALRAIEAFQQVISENKGETRLPADGELPAEGELPAGRGQASGRGQAEFDNGRGQAEFDKASEISATRSAIDVNRLTPARERARKFLIKNQQADGSWLPLWFGNQDRSDESNPIYGTSRVLLAGADLLGPTAIQRGCEYLISSQNKDGGWGGGPSVTRWFGDRHDLGDRMSSQSEFCSSVEETALAIEALTAAVLSEGFCPEDIGFQWDREFSNAEVGNDKSTAGCQRSRIELVGSPGEQMSALAGPGGQQRLNREKNRDKSESVALERIGGGNSGLALAIIRGVEFLLEGIESDRHHVAWPIGFYFAKLWYYEKLYPLIFSATALGKFLRMTADSIDFPPNAKNTPEAEKYPGKQ